MEYIDLLGMLATFVAAWLTPVILACWCHARPGGNWLVFFNALAWTAIIHIYFI